jgi:hypothetical protein
MRLKTPPPSKAKLLRKAKRFIAAEIANMWTRNPAGHDWLVRHVERQNGRCAYCGIPMFMPPKYKPPKRDKDGRRATLDHVVPLARGGADSEENTVAACEACNTEKAVMPALAFRMSAFCVARKAFAAKVPAHVERTVVVKVRKRPRATG